jgi:hypothetical protein
LYQVTATNPENAKSAKEDSETVFCSYFLKTYLYYTPGNRDKTKMYLVNFPFFDGFCFKNGARAVCRKIGRLTKHKRGAIKINPARRWQIQGCCLETRRFCRKAAGSELGRNEQQQTSAALSKPNRRKARKFQALASESGRVTANPLAPSGLVFRPLCA